MLPPLRLGQESLGTFKTPLRHARVISTTEALLIDSRVFAEQLATLVQPANILIPTDSDLQRAAAVLNDGKKVAMLIGAGAMNATREVEEVAELLGQVLQKRYLARQRFPIICRMSQVVSDCWVPSQAGI